MVKLMNCRRGSLVSISAPCRKDPSSEYAIQSSLTFVDSPGSRWPLDNSLMVHLQVVLRLMSVKGASPSLRISNSYDRDVSCSMTPKLKVSPLTSTAFGSGLFSPLAAAVAPPSRPIPGGGCV